MNLGGTDLLQKSMRSAPACLPAVHCWPRCSHNCQLALPVPSSFPKPMAGRNGNQGSFLQIRHSRLLPLKCLNSMRAYNL